MSIIEKLTESSKGKNWWIRTPLLFLYVYLLFKHLQDPLYAGIVDGLNLGIHEAGHALFIFFSDTLSAAGGTILQLFLPIISIFIFLKQKDYFAISFSFAWISTNLFGIATYMRDAVRMQLPMVSLSAGGQTTHDWNYLFSEFKVLHYHAQIASFVRTLGVVTMLFAIFWAALVIFLMFKKRV